MWQSHQLAVELHALMKPGQTYSKAVQRIVGILLESTNNSGNDLHRFAPLPHLQHLGIGEWSALHRFLHGGFRGTSLSLNGWLLQFLWSDFPCRGSRLRWLLRHGHSGFRLRLFLHDISGRYDLVVQSPSLGLIGNGKSSTFSA